MFVKPIRITKLYFRVKFTKWTTLTIFIFRGKCTKWITLSQIFFKRHRSIDLATSEVAVVLYQVHVSHAVIGQYNPLEPGRPIRLQHE